MPAWLLKIHAAMAALLMDYTLHICIAGLLGHVHRKDPVGMPFFIV
ncbi:MULTISPECIES: hypothetical protein [Paenibacillus]|nr:MULTISPECIES: hypothetical protein [Paenibacillus]MEC0172080.1 hypothetical protein [Paenibacillus graminis]